MREFKPTSRPWAKLLVLLAPMMVAAACADHEDPARGILNEADALEKEGSKFGSIWVGAVRIADYDAEGLESERKARRTVLVAEWESAAKLKLSDLKPDRTDEKHQKAEGTLGIQLPGGLPVAPAAAAVAEKGTPDEKGIEGSATTRALGPNPTDLLVRKLALLNRIQSELEEDDLSNLSAMDPKRYHRIQLSLSLTAWTQGGARAALVYMDVYPYNGDRGCHEVADAAAHFGEGEKEEIQKTASEVKGEKAKQVLEQRAAKTASDMRERFVRSFVQEAFASPPEELPGEAEFLGWLGRGKAAYGLCHAALDTYHLLPRLVKVESLGDTIFAGSRQVSDYAGGVNVKSQPAAIAAKAETSDAVAEESVSLTTLSFAAGSRRAGWFFMARSGKTMSPVERRVRLVIDLPINLKRLEVHVHKSFLDEKDALLSGFSDQLDKSIRARNLLDRIEMEFPTDPGCPDTQLFCSPTQWQLTKTRARNLSDHAWSERLLVDVDPAIFKGLSSPAQARTTGIKSRTTP